MKPSTSESWLANKLIGRHSSIFGWLVGRYLRFRWRMEGFFLTHLTDLFLLQRGWLRHRIRQDQEFLQLHARLCRDNVVIQSTRERYNLWRLVKTARRLKGDMAEVGVDRGGSAKIICAAKGSAALHLFDTFQGMPKTDLQRDGAFRAGDFSESNLGRVQAYLKSESNVHFHPGFFPETTRALPADARFCLVHLDVDLYQSTLACLEYFYPRLVRGGILISHDYSQIVAPGVKQAFDEFFADKDEPVIELWDTQCMFVKM